MSDSFVKIRVRVGENEAEIEAPLSIIKETIKLVPEVIEHLPTNTQNRIIEEKYENKNRIQILKKDDAQKIFPEVKIEKDDSLPNVIIKFFQDNWGRKPRKLNEIKDTLESYGLIYPKQSVAVALLRLAKDGKLRRFKDENNEFVYTSSTSLIVQNTLISTKNTDFEKNM